jgi:hypothetical protein
MPIEHLISLLQLLHRPRHLSFSTAEEQKTNHFLALPINQKRAHTTHEANHMLAVAGVWKKKRDDLKAKRNSLFEKYARHPEEFHLALEIKKIDDEIADCTQHVEQERRSERSASSTKKLHTASK